MKETHLELWTARSFNFTEAKQNPGRKKNFESKYEESEPDENWAQDEKGCEEFITQWDDISG